MLAILLMTLSPSVNAAYNCDKQSQDNGHTHRAGNTHQIKAISRAALKQTCVVHTDCNVCRLHFYNTYS